MKKMNYDKFLDEELINIREKYKQENIPFSPKEEEWWKGFFKEQKRSREELKAIIEPIKDIDPELYKRLMKDLEGKASEGKKQKSEKPQAQKSREKKQEESKSQETRESENKKEEGKKPEAQKPQAKKPEVKETKSEEPTVMKYQGIENEYIHSSQYQLDDWEVNRILKLKRDLEIVSDPEKKNKIRCEMAVILGRENNWKVPQTVVPKQEEKKEQKNDDSLLQQEKKDDKQEDNRQQEDKPTKIETMKIEQIRARYKQIMAELEMQKENGEVNEEVCRKLYNEYCKLTQRAEELGETIIGETKLNLNTKPNKPVQSQEIPQKSSSTKSNEESSFLPNKEGKVKRFFRTPGEMYKEMETDASQPSVPKTAREQEKEEKRKVRELRRREKKVKGSIFKRIGDFLYEMQSEEDKIAPREIEREEENDIFGRLSEEQIRKNNMEIRKNMAEDVKKILAQDKQHEQEKTH